MTESDVVRVVITTFNHERFIGQAVESVVTQETSFPFEVIVIDDCSTDGTAQVLAELAERYRGRFTVRRPPRNRNDHHDFGTALDECASPYIALLDGDDYWSSSTKLAQQICFLERHHQYAIACHAVNLINEDGTPAEVRYDRPHSHYIRDDLWSACFIHTGSVVFRRSAFDRLPDWYYASVAGDWELFLLLTLRGDIWLGRERLSAYRVHPEGQWSGIDARRQARQVHDFYRHQARAWGRAFRANRVATLSRAATLAFRYGEAGARLRAWRWLMEAGVRSTVHRPGVHGPSRHDIKRLVAWRVRSDRDHLLLRDRRMHSLRHGAGHGPDGRPTLG